MSTSKSIDRICIFAVIAALLISILCMGGSSSLIQSQPQSMGYEDRLFDTSKVHTIDIVIDDWDGFLETAQSEEYTVCDVVIDGEAFNDVGIRGKGNTSLSTVASMDSDRYSFKIEFDQYDSTKSYYGLDKLSLNNLIQDNTMMKDYLVYQMMNEFGVAAPLCSYVYITVNGEDWGLYLAVEAVEESFLQRNYGSDYGELYKPDSMDMGGGRGNGMDFSAEDSSGFGGQNSGNMGGFGMSIDEAALYSAFEELGLDTSVLADIDFDNITMAQIQSVLSGLDQATVQQLTQMLMGDASAGGMGGSMSMGSSGTKLQYVDDDPDSYSVIFSSAKTAVTDADQTRLIAALKDLSEGDAGAVDTEAVIRYFVVHNFVVNGDSYTGSMVHNYYLYEKDGQLSMIPWDYNLAFGTFQGSSAADAVNDDIDAPLSVTGSDRPMIDWIFSSEEYTQLYHQYFREFLETVDAQAIISQAKALIAPYVEKDPTKFCTYAEFEAGVETLSTFCELRSQSVQQQLNGGEADVDASSVNLADMGTMNSSMGGGWGKMPGSNSDSTDQSPQFPGAAGSFGSGDGQTSQMPGGQGGMQMPGQGDMTLPEGAEMPEGMEDKFSGQTGGVRGSFSGWEQSGTATQDISMWILLAVTIIILGAGLIFVFKFRR